MNICFLSYELPPMTQNGIGSYVFQVSRALAKAGHRITVISGEGNGQPPIDELYEGIRIIRLKWEQRNFPWLMRATHQNLQQVALICLKLHRNIPFDIIEGPDFRAEAYYLLKNGIDCPIVTKLHTPCRIVWELESTVAKVNFGRALNRWLVISFLGRLETLVLSKATRVHAPSRGIVPLVEKHYEIKLQNLDIVPYTYNFQESSPVARNGDEFTVLYVGRLEAWKGVHLFSRIIPRVLRQIPQAQFLFLGKDQVYGENPSMAHWLQKQLGELASKCFFLGLVPYLQVKEYMRRATLCVFPSLWDNFPNVCLEAMDAEACVVGSYSGGMAEMIIDGECGFLADPQRPETFSEKILTALGDSDLRKRLGRAARQRVQDLYRPEVIIPLQVSAYEKAIEQFHRR